GLRENSTIARARALREKEGARAVGDVHLLRSRLEHEIERGLRGAPEMAEAGALSDVAQPGLARLRSECRADFLRERRLRAHQGRHRIENAADRVEIRLRVV